MEISIALQTASTKEHQFDLRVMKQLTGYQYVAEALELVRNIIVA